MIDRVGVEANAFGELKHICTPNRCEDPSDLACMFRGEWRPTINLSQPHLLLLDKYVVGKVHIYS